MSLAVNSRLGVAVVCKHEKDALRQYLNHTGLGTDAPVLGIKTPTWFLTMCLSFTCYLSSVLLLVAMFENLFDGGVANHSKLYNQFACL